MPPDYVIFGVFVVVLFYVCQVNQNSQIAATASAIRQVFSGGCRLNCRENSAVSGLSGIQGISTTYRATTGNRQEVCVCESCPCRMIDKFLITCSPATQLINNILLAIARLYDAVINLLSDIFEYFSRVRMCRGTCQNQVKLHDITSFDSSENFNLEGVTPEMRDKPSPKQSILAILKKSSHLINEAKAGKSKAGKSKKVKDDKMKTGSDDSQKPIVSTSKGYNCPRCVEKGRTCLRECPRAKK